MTKEEMGFGIFVVLFCVTISLGFAIMGGF